MAAVGAQIRSSSTPGGVSRLSMMQARYREQLMLEKESRLLEMAARQEAEREDIINRVTKTSANSLSSSMSSLSSSGAGQGRVRKMFEDRRHGRTYHQSPKGIDKSNPLEPVKRDSGGGGGGGRMGMRGSSQPSRGMSVDRFMSQPEENGMPRSRSQAPFQRSNRGDNRVQKPPKAPPGKRFPTYHKSTSSLMDTNNYSRGPSPGPPSSTKSSPGPRGPPVAPPRRANPIKKPPQNNYLSVNGKSGNRNSRSRSPSPSPRDGPDGKGFFAKLGFNNKPKPESSFKPKPTPSKSKSSDDEEDETEDDDENELGGDDDCSDDELSVHNKENGGLSAAGTPRGRSPVPDGLKRCKICERNFAPDRLEKHEIICAKSRAKQKKRKIFDPVKMRTSGTEAEQYVARGEHLKENKKEKKHNWRKKHEDFIATVRAAKGIKGYEAPPMDTSDYVVCPHCGRKFSEQVADRHIPKCENIESNKAGRRPGPPPKAPVGRRR